MSNNIASLLNMNTKQHFCKYYIDKNENNVREFFRRTGCLTSITKRLTEAVSHFKHVRRLRSGVGSSMRFKRIKRESIIVKAWFSALTKA